MVAEGIWTRYVIPASTVGRARSGSDEDVAELIRASWPHAYRIARSIVRDRWLAEDVAQEACSAIARAIGDLRSSAAFGVWFYRIVVRTSFETLKRHGSVAEADEVAVVEDLGGSVLRIDVLNALARLTPRQRAVVALHYYADMTSREISKVLGIPDGTVRFHLSNARRTLEHLLTEQGYGRT